MMSETATQLSSHLQDIKAQRKEGSLDLKSYYMELLKMVSDLSASLVDEVPHLSDEEVVLQVPLVLLFAEEQVRKFGNRA